MRVNVALFTAGALLVLIGVAMWSLPAVLVLAGLPCIGLGLLRAEAARKPAAKPAKAAVRPRHRRPAADRARGVLRLVRAA